MPPRQLPRAGKSTRNRSRLPRRAFAALLATTLTATAAAVVTASPAAAGIWDVLRPVSVSYTDSRQPDTSFPAESDFPVGKWRSDTGMHISQAYLTFDLTPYQGKEIIQAKAGTGETSVADCDRPREVEIWRTATPASAPTWNDAPATETKIGDVGAGYEACPAPHLELDLADALQDALDDGRERVTFLLRISGDHQDNPHHSRRMKPLAITLRADAAPHVPTRLRIDNRDCAQAPLLNNRTPTLSAQLTDPDGREGDSGDRVVATFAYWPLERPDERTEWQSHFGYTPTTISSRISAELADGRYAFAVKATDEHASSDWSPACEFTLDATPPATPTVTSGDYPGPGGGAGIPGVFTFTAESDDLAGFRYGEFEATQYVAVEEGSRSASVTITPASGGQFVLYVQSVDKAGNRSRSTTYTSFVPETAPLVTDANPSGPLGEPRELTFSPRLENVVEYTYRFNGGEPVTVPAGADGTATVTIVPDRPGENTVSVTSRTADGLTSGTVDYRIHLVTWPRITSVEYPLDGPYGAPAGTPGTFVFHPGMPDVVEYVYSINYGPEETIAAEADGTARLLFTPAEPGRYRLTVYSRSSDGSISDETSQVFRVS